MEKSRGKIIYSINKAVDDYKEILRTISNSDNKQQEEKMETKSRYEVISELEAKKRELIRERDTYNDRLVEKEKALKMMERDKQDSIVQFDRDIADRKDDINNFKKTIDEKKETVKELIKSIDISLERFGKLADKRNDK